MMTATTTFMEPECVCVTVSDLFVCEDEDKLYCDSSVCHSSVCHCSVCHRDSSVCHSSVCLCFRPVRV